jgi:glycerophosphoryl diester phosphodiesterase
VPPSPWAYLDAPGPLAFAHRGGAGLGAENTLAAFQRAVDLGYRYLESDTQLTSDGVLVAFHDDDLTRLVGRPQRISQLPHREIASIRIDGESIPTVEEVLGSWPGLRVNLDPKRDQAVTPLADVIRRTNSSRRVGIGSFSDGRLARMRRLVGEELCTSLGPLGVARLRASALRLPAGPFRAACAQVPVHGPRGVTIVDERLVAAAHRRGMQVHVWTVDDPDEMVRLLDLGVDGLMSDRPEVLKDVLVARGEWW